MVSKETMNFTYKLVIGDWSKDGHNQSEFFHFKCTHPDVDIKKAYKQAVNKSGISFSQGKSGPGVKRVILSRYQDDLLTSEDVKALTTLGVKLDFMEGSEGLNEAEGSFPEIHVSPTEAATLFLEMVRSQLPGFDYHFVDDEVKCINGFWSKDFNISIGYGCYES